MTGDSGGSTGEEDGEDGRGGSGWWEAGRRTAGLMMPVSGVDAPDVRAEWEEGRVAEAAVVLVLVLMCSGEVEDLARLAVEGEVRPSRDRSSGMSSSSCLGLDRMSWSWWSGLAWSSE